MTDHDSYLRLDLNRRRLFEGKLVGASRDAVAILVLHGSARVGEKL